MLNGFEIISENDQRAECIATINTWGMTFTNQTLLNFNTPEFVVMGVNKEKKQLGIAACPQGENARVFCKAGNTQNARINFGTYKREIVEMMPEWDFEKFNYRVYGVFSEDHTEMVFNLLTAEAKAKRNRKKVEEPKEEKPEVKEEVVAFPDNLEPVKEPEEPAFESIAAESET